MCHMLKDHFLSLLHIVDVYMYIAYACMYVYALDTVVLIFCQCLCANFYKIYFSTSVWETGVFFVCLINHFLLHWNVQIYYYI